MISSQTKYFVKLSLLFSLVILTNCVTNTSTPVTGIASPTPTTSSQADITSSSSPNPISSSSPNLLPSPIATPTSSQSNTGNLSTLILQSDFLKVSYVDYYSTDLKWSKVNGAKSYKIYQDGKIIADNLTDLAYSVKNLTPNTDYTFEIIAVNDAGESNRAILKVRTFIPSNSSGSGNSGNNNQGTVIVTPSPSANVQFNGGYN